MCRRLALVALVVCALAPAAGAQETLLPDAVTQNDGNRWDGPVTDINNGVDTWSNSWMSGAGADTRWTQVSFPTPTDDPGRVNARARIRRSGNLNGNDPVITFYLYEGTTLIDTSPGQPLNGTGSDTSSGQVLEHEFVGFTLTDPTGADLELRVEGTVAGSGGGTRRPELGEVEVVSEELAGGVFLIPLL